VLHLQAVGLPHQQLLDNDFLLQQMLGNRKNGFHQAALNAQNGFHGQVGLVLPLVELTPEYLGLIRQCGCILCSISFRSTLSDALHQLPVNPNRQVLLVQTMFSFSIGIQDWLE
jgi:hypothetical protein